MHAFWWVKECPKRVASQTPPKVLERNERSHVPAIPRIAERDQAARSLSCAAEQVLGIRIAADYAIERDDVGVGKRGCHGSEITNDESSKARSVP